MPIHESFFGFIESTTDALLVFEACRRGKLPKISRRLQDRERGSIKSGTVFVFDEKESGIKRWTDGLVWSPSRILGNFLIYRELDGRESLYQHNRAPFDYDPSHYSAPYDYGAPQHDSMQPLVGELSNEERNRERNLVGSLTDTYKFRKGGLIKKTISIHLNGSTQHMISYYTRSDVLEGRLATPSSVSDLSDLQISPDLLLKQSFRVPPSVEFAELLLKRPSLSPTSTSSTTSTATASTTLRRKLSHATIGAHALYESHPAARIPNEEFPALCK
ncbi:Gti1/Pac2 family-domain-containing protein [Mucor lusitanicus]|uniref:Gti1/Pac2 family-domain-containing protein n=2 Tax=Mucor circinelloides f. lusitanicus TaxID=29924 RepID=A0A8H4EZ72_MUCCL|nr:Gti1/Pac2 family-domain-containing protein [Mucor lusitanicus]